MLNKYIAYEGESFTIEWYFDSRFKSVAFEYYQKLTLNQKEKHKALRAKDDYINRCIAGNYYGKKS